MASHPLNGAFERVNRASEHLAELERLISAFQQAYHDAIVIEFDPEPPHELSFDVQGVSYPEHGIAILIGEVCYNLRTALDYLIYELSLLDDPHVAHKRTQFPI